MTLLQQTIDLIKPLNQTTMQQTQDRLNQLIKPAGSLGQLEKIVIQLAGISGRLDIPLVKKQIVVLAADHGVVEEGVSTVPQEITALMVQNFLQNRAAINVLAHQIGAILTVVDMGIASPITTKSRYFLNRKIAPGTHNITTGPAMTREQAKQAIETGIHLVNTLSEQKGLDLLIPGEMGIGNTTPSAAIAALYTGLSPTQVTGRGTGVDDAGLQRKIAAVEKALQHNKPDINDPLDILYKVGGFEIGGIAGLILGAAAHQIPVMLDGFIATAGALLAAHLAPLSKGYLISGHQSQECGHQAMLAHLGLEPLLNLDLHLGEGSGAALATPLVETAVHLLNNMSTFAEANIPNG